jgi:hypothetical protein
VVGAEVGVVGAWDRPEGGGFEVGWGCLFHYLFLMGLFFGITYIHAHTHQHPIHHRYYSIEITENPPLPQFFFNVL